jgi:hypothetical protein
MQRISKNLLLEWSFSLLLTMAFIFLRGYTFNYGDQADHLLPVYEKIEPGTFKGDFFMDYQSISFSIRQAYIWLLVGLNYLAPLNFWCFILTVACIFSSILAWSKIAFKITGNEISKYVAPLLIFFLFYNFTVGGCSLMYSIFITSTMAKAIVPWAILFFLRNKHALAALFLGIATMFHAIVGLQVFLIFSLILLWNSSRNNFSIISWKQLGLFVLIYGCIAAFVLVPNIQLQFFNDFKYDKSVYNQIFYHFRNPHHYLPSVFPLNDWLKYGLIVSIILVAIFKKDRSKLENIVLIFIAVQTLGIFVYTLLIEARKIYTFNSIQWYKTTIWTTAFACIILSKWISNLEVVKDVWSKYSWLFQNWKLNLIGAFLVLFLILNAKLIPIEKFKSRYYIGNHKKTELQIVHEWIKQNTPKGSMFIAPPSDFGFGCETQRPAVINAKALVHEPKYMLLWYERFTNIYKTSLADLKGRSFVEVAEINYKKGNFNANSFGAKYGLVYKPMQMQDKVLFETENYAVVKFYLED